MASYKVLIKSSAAKELEAVVQKRQRDRLIRRILALADEPRPVGSEKLSVRHGLFRIRVGSYRVLYQVDDTTREVYVIKIGHRRDAYR